MSDQGPDITGPGGPDETDADLTAAEHVLGLTDGDARVAAADRARADPDFAARLDAWERRLSPLIGDVAPINPPDAVWTRIAGSIAAESLNSSPATSTVFAFPDRGRGLDNLTVWRAATGLSALAAACLAIVLMLPSRPAAPAAQQIATLAAPDGKALYVATLDVTRDTVTVVPVGGLAAPGRSPELWIIPAGGKPRPVGLLPAASARLPASAAVISDAKAKAILAVSLEPHGGSPNGAPTGPVIASGPLQAL
jgi:anti-sigma-K factor RskA